SRPLPPPRPTLFPYTTLFRSPAGTPPEVIAKLNKSLQNALNDEDVKKSLATFGADGSYSTPDEFKSLIASEAKKWTSIIENAGRSEEHTSELQSRENLVCRLL